MSILTALPEIAPTVRSFAMDEWPQSGVKMRGGRTVKWAQVNSPAGASLELVWENITYAQAETILSVWDANYGIYGSVDLGLSEKPPPIPWTPAQTATALWLDASDAATITVATGASEWRDKSGNARHITQGTTSQQPAVLTSELNSLDVLRFDGSNDRMTRAAFLPNTLTVAFLAKRTVTGATGVLSQNNNTNNAGRFIAYSESGASFEAGLQIGTFSSKAGTATGGWGIWVYTRSGATAEAFRDGGSGGALTVGAATIQATDFAIGAANNSGSDYGGHDVAEVVVLDGVAAQENRQLIEGYLAWKWGLESILPSGHPYKGSAPTGPGAGIAGALLGASPELGALMREPFASAAWRFQGPPTVEAVKARRCTVRLPLRTKNELALAYPPAASFTPVDCFATP